jgi:hypothetical protein
VAYTSPLKVRGPSNRPAIAPPGYGQIHQTAANVSPEEFTD